MWNEFSDKKSKNKRAEGKRKENLREGAEEKKTRKRKKNSGKKKKFFQETIGSTRVYIIVERARTRGRIRFVPSGPAPPDPEPRSLRSSSEKWAAKTNEKSWLRSDIKSPATVSSLNLVIYHVSSWSMRSITRVSKKKSRQTVCVCVCVVQIVCVITNQGSSNPNCLCQRVRADAVVLARLSFSEALLALSCEWECWNDMKVVTFRLAWGHGPWAPELHMATALDKSTHFLAAFLFVATTKAWARRSWTNAPNRSGNKLRLRQTNVTK